MGRVRGHRVEVLGRWLSTNENVSVLGAVYGLEVASFRLMLSCLVHGSSRTDSAHSLKRWRHGGCLGLLSMEF
jgi:hypothetical protein